MLNIQSILYKKNICPRFNFALFVIFVSQRVKVWRISMPHLISLLLQNCWGEFKTSHRQQKRKCHRAKIILCTVYTCGKALKLINLVVVKRYKTTRDTLSNSLIIAQQMHKQLQFILRTIKIALDCEYTKRCETLVLIFVRCNNLDRIRQPLNSVQATNAIAREMYAKPKNSNPKVL